MKALTLQQPWAWAVCHAGKRCENRAWLGAPGLLAVARSLVGQRFAVHAGLNTGWTRAEFHATAEDMIARSSLGARIATLPPVLQRIGNRWALDAEAPRGAIVATATLADVYEGGSLGHRRHDFGRCSLCGQENPTQRELIRGAPLGGGQCPKRDPWAIDCQTWLILADVRVLPVPVPAKGAQGWWTVPESVEVPR